jgi:phage baseplate assembly protein W
MTFSPANPPTPAMFALDQLQAVDPVPASIDWSEQLDTPGSPGSGLGQIVQGIDDVQQCLQIIFTTPRGSDPLRPNFACDLWKYVDMPVDVALPNIAREVADAMALWEPRAVLESVSVDKVDPSDDEGAHLVVTVIWHLALASPTPQTSGIATTVTIFGS